MTTTLIKSKCFKIAHNRGKPRVWIEGKFLIEAGIKRGQHFSKSIEDNTMRLELDEDGRHTVAGTEARPIIDLNGKYLIDLFKGCSHYWAQIYSRSGFEDNSKLIYIEGLEL